MRLTPHRGAQVAMELGPPYTGRKKQTLMDQRGSASINIGTYRHHIHPYPAPALL